jgi:hypothetical protein
MPSKDYRMLRGCEPIPLAATRAGPAPPVSPVLSGRDQASPTPTMTIPHPLGAPDARIGIIRIWQLCDRNCVLREKGFRLSAGT